MMTPFLRNFLAPKRERGGGGVSFSAAFSYEVLICIINTADSRYLEIERTLKNTSRYPYFDISDL